MHDVSSEDYSYMADEVVTTEADDATEEGQDDLHELRERLIDALGVEAAKMVREAVEARERSGVEKRWEEDLSNYYGSDLETVPPTVIDRVTREKRTAGELDSRSSIGVNITRPKTNAAHARIIEMATPTDERNFAIRPSPIPTLARELHNTSTVLTRDGVPIQKEDGTPMTAADYAKMLIDEAERAASAMQRVIDDQLSECDFTGEVRLAYFDAVLFGTGIMCGPLPKKVTRKSWTRDESGAWVQTIKEEYVPWSERIPPQDFFPDPAGRGRMRDCRYAVWRKFYNEMTLKELKGSPGAIDERIDEVCKEGPNSIKNSNAVNQRRFLDGDYFFDDKLLYEAFFVAGRFPKECIIACGVPLPDGLAEREDIPAIVCVVNGRAIKAALNPLDSGELPFDMMHYERIQGQPWGVGVPFILRNPQRVIRAAWRMIMENAAQNIGGQLIVNRDVISPANGSWEMTGKKVWYLTSEKGQANSARVQDAFGFFNPESRIDQLLKIIEFALRFAEDETSLPALLEGRRGSAPDTVGGMQLLDNRANEVLMRLIRHSDDDCIKPHIARYYEWNMQHGEDESIKGDMNIIPLGAAALRARTVESEALMNIGAFVQSGQFARFHKRGGYDWLRRVYKLLRLDPDEVLETPDRVDEILKAEAENPPPKDPRIEVEELRAKVKAYEIAEKSKQQEAEREHDKNKETLRFQAEMLKIAEELAAERQITLEQAKAELARIIIKETNANQRAATEMALKLNPRNPTGQGI